MKIVEVVWDDAHVSTGETTIKRAGKMKAIRTHTVGYLVAENDAGVILVTDRYEKTPKSGRIVNFIPHGMIVTYDELTETKL